MRSSFVLLTVGVVATPGGLEPLEALADVCPTALGDALLFPTVLVAPLEVIDTSVELALDGANASLLCFCGVKVPGRTFLADGDVLAFEGDRGLAFRLKVSCLNNDELSAALTSVSYALLGDPRAQNRSYMLFANRAFSIKLFRRTCRWSMVLTRRSANRIISSDCFVESSNALASWRS